MKVHYIIGLAGVDQEENEIAIRWQLLFEVPMLLIAIWIPVHWYLEAKQILPADISQLIDWAVWSVFVLETTLLVFLVNNKRRYLQANWMNLFIITGGLPLLWVDTPLAAFLRSLRLLLTLGLILKFSRTLRRLLARNALGITLLAAFAVVIVSGLVIVALDPAINTLVDGFWWAVVTMSTVGYGDVVPVSGAGRFFAIILILLGVVLFSLLTANISAYLIDRETEPEQRRIERELADIKQQLKQIERQLQQAQESGARSEGSEDAGQEPGFKV